MGALTERNVRQKIMRHFIEQDKIVVDVSRPITSSTAGGGVVKTGQVVITNQTFYYMPMKRRLTEEDNYNPQSFGEDRVQMVDYILIFMPGESDLMEGDYITSIDGHLDDGDYRVMFVSARDWDRRQAGILKR